MKSKYKQILGRIKTARRRETTMITLRSISDTIFITGAAVLMFSFIELLAVGDTEFRSLLALGILAVFGGSFLYFMRVPIGRAAGMKAAPTIDDTAKQIGTKYPEVGDKLCNAVQIYRNKGNNNIFSEELTEAAFADVSKEVENLDFNRIVSRKPAFYAGIRMGIILVLAAAIFLVSKGMFASFERIVNYDKSYIPPAPFNLKIIASDTTALRGETIMLRVKAEGDAPSKIRLKMRLDKQTNFDTYELTEDSSGVFSYEIKSVKRSFEYYAEADWLSQIVATDTHSLRVIYLPIVRSLQGSMRMPNYTGLAGRNFDEKNADIVALRGSSVKLTAFANKDLEKASIVMINPKDIPDSLASDTAYIPQYDTVNVRMRVENRKAEGRFFVFRTGTYRIKLEDIDGRTNQTPIVYNITCLNDEYPRIVQTEPKQNKEISKEGLLPIYANISDDYGFKYLRLYYRLAFSKYSSPEEKFSFIDIPINPTRTNAEVIYVWDLHEHQITPEDAYEYYLEVADNDVVEGPKTARTSKLTVRLPSMSEVAEETDMMFAEMQKEMQEAFKEASDLKKEMEQFNREMLKKGKGEKLDWSEQNKAKELMNRQKQLQDKMKSLGDKMQESTDKLQNHQMMSPETLQKFMELQDLMKEVDSPELRAMQEKMKKAMENMSAEDMKKAMEDYEFNEEQFKQGIERTMELLKRLQAEQKAGELSKRAEQLAERQEKLKEESLKNGSKNQETRDALQKKQDRLKDDFEQLADDFKDFEKMTDELGKESVPEDELKSAREKLQEQDTKQQMSEASQKMQSGKMQDASQNQQKAAQNMKQFAESMSGMQQSMHQDTQEEVKQKLQKAGTDMQELSEKQEKLAEKTADAGYNSTKLPDYAKEQAEIFEQMANVASALSELAKKTPVIPQSMAGSINRAGQAMQNSVEQMADGRSTNAARSQKQAMANLNGAMAQIQQQMSAMNQSGSCSNPGGQGQGQGQGQGSGMMPNMGGQMQKMAAQQMHINQSLQQMMQQGAGKSGGQGKGGQKLSSRQMAEAKRLGGEMGKSGKSLRKMAEEQKKFGNSERKAGEMKKLAEEMEKVAKNISQGNITPKTLERQQQILNKMLDISQSINDRDFEKKREAKEGKNYRLVSPDELDLMSEEGRKQAYKELMEAGKQGYSKDYEELIKQYFEALRETPAE